MKSIITFVFISLAFTVHVTIQLLTRYLDYKHKNGLIENSVSTTIESKTSLVNSKHTVSLGSALFFVLVLIAGLLSNSGTRTVKLFYLMPLEITAMAVCFPMLIIIWNPNLKKTFLQHYLEQHMRLFKCCCSNRIEPII